MSKEEVKNFIACVEGTTIISAKSLDEAKKQLEDKLRPILNIPHVDVFPESELGIPFVHISNKWKASPYLISSKRITIGESFDWLSRAGEPFVWGSEHELFSIRIRFKGSECDKKEILQALEKHLDEIKKEL